MQKKLFNVDSDTKKMLQSISNTFLVPNDLVNRVWEYTIFTMALKIAEGAEEDKITIPYIGSLFLENKGNVIDKNGQAQVNIGHYLELSDSFKEIYKNVKNGSFNCLSDYFDENYIKKVIEQYKES